MLKRLETPDVADCLVGALVNRVLGAIVVTFDFLMVSSIPFASQFNQCCLSGAYFMEAQNSLH